MPVKDPFSKPKRWSLQTITWWDGDTTEEMRPSGSGDFVTWDDYKKLLAAYIKLKQNGRSCK